MQSLRIIAVLVFLLATAALVGPTLQAKSPLDGSWELIPAKSTEIDLYGTLSLRLAIDNESVMLVPRWGDRRSFTDSLVLPTSGAPTKVRIQNRVFPSNVFMGLSMPVGQERTLRANGYSV